MNRLARLDEDDRYADPRGEPRVAGDAAPLQEEPVLGFRSAEKVFPNGKRGLAPIDLKIRRGEFISLIGPSGCGKSTLLKLAANLIEPSDGRMLWWQAGFETVGGPGRRLAFVFQEPTLMPWSRVEANVALPLEAAGVGKAEARDRARGALRLVGLEAQGGLFPSQLSGGMQMRVSIARALVVDPQILLMDEPFGALDELTRNQLDEDLAALARARGCTTLFVTHSIQEAVFLSSRVIVMAANPGRVHGQMAVDEAGPRDGAFRDSDTFFTRCRALSARLAEASAASRGAGDR